MDLIVYNGTPHWGETSEKLQRNPELQPVEV